MFPRPPQQRLAQRGQILLLLVILVVGFGAAFYAFVDFTSSAIERDKITTAALAQTKEALIGWSAARTPSTSALIPPGLNARPGELPCPDSDNSGTDSGSCVAGAIGRVPWRTLGIPEPKDGAGETLWYAIAGPFRNYNMSSAAITSDTLGNITVYQNSAATTLTTQAVAVIFAPGAPVGTQVRSTTDTMACTAPSGTYARNLCASNYLDLEPASGTNNATINGPFIQAQKSPTFNDRLLVITNADLMPLVEQRVAREMMSILQNYKAVTGVYPWADRSDGGANFGWNHNRFPCGTALPTNWGSGVQALPLWLTNGCNCTSAGQRAWSCVILYAVAKNKLEGGGSGCNEVCNTSSLTVNNPNSRPADLCLTGVSPFVCTPTVVSNGSADLVLITPGAATASRAAGWPSANFTTPITLYFEDAQNGANNSDTYVVPSSTNYDRDRIYIVR